MRASVTVLGGAGFIGSRVVERCVAAGLQTTVIDGMLPKTGARPANLNACRSSINLETRRIEHAENLSDVLRSSDAIVDCMGWTCHRSAALDPLYDLELNVQSHVAWLSRVPPRREQRVIYLGSRVQYGRVDGVIDESTPMRPVDVQGVHKLAAEHHFQ